MQNDLRSLAWMILGIILLLLGIVLFLALIYATGKS